MSLVQYAKRQVRILLGRDVRSRVQVRRPMLRLGSGYGGWSVWPEPLCADSVVYSFGVGEDISWDLALIERFGVQIHAFDPTPRALAWVQQQNPPPNFHMHAVALAATDGTARFSAPENPAFVSHTLLPRANGAAAGLEVPTRRLTSLMQQLGHQRLDILKMDIEGAEYEVLPDLLAAGVPIGQLMVEFHHRFPEVGVGRTETALEQLRQAGFQIAAISATGDEYSFLQSQGGL